MNIHKVVIYTASLALLSTTLLAAERYRFRLEDNDGKRTEKRMDLRRKRVTLIREISSGACRKNRTWGYDNDGVWVSGYCKGEFEVTDNFDIGGDNGGGWRPPIGGGRPIDRIRVQDNDGRRTERKYDLRGRTVRLARTLGDRPCREGRSWGYNNRLIWVDDYCKGEFEIYSNRR